jgi:integrase
MSISKRGNTYWIDTTWGGKRYRESLRTNDRSVAVERAKAYETALFLGNIGLQAKQTETDDDLLSVADTFDKALRHEWKHLKSHKTLQINSQSIIDLIGTMPLSEVTSDTVRTLRANLEATGNSIATVNRKMATLNSVLRLAKDSWGILDSIPQIKLVKENNARTFIFSKVLEDQVSIKADELGYKKLSLLIPFLADTGFRLSNALDIEQATIQGNTLMVRMTKNGDAHAVPATPRIRELVKDGIPWRGLTKDKAEDQWSQVRKAMGYAKNREFVLHALRHTCATRLLEAGFDLYTVKHWLGHKDINTTLRYVKLTSKHLEDAVTKLCRHNDSQDNQG